MNAADLYFDAEIGLLSQQRAERLAAERKRLAEDQARRERYERRRRHEVPGQCACDDGGVCLLDVKPEKLMAALAEMGGEMEAAMRKARDLYLAGRPHDAMDVLYPTVRGVLGVAV